MTIEVLDEPPRQRFEVLVDGRVAGFAATPVRAYCPFVSSYLERHPELPVVVEPRP